MPEGRREKPSGRCTASPWEGRQKTSRCGCLGSVKKAPVKHAEELSQAKCSGQPRHSETKLPISGEMRRSRAKKKPRWTMARKVSGKKSGPRVGQTRTSPAFRGGMNRTYLQRERGMFFFFVLGFNFFPKSTTRAARKKECREEKKGRERWKEGRTRQCGCGELGDSFGASGRIRCRARLRST